MKRNATACRSVRWGRVVLVAAVLLLLAAGFVLFNFFSRNSPPRGAVGLPDARPGADAVHGTGREVAGRAGVEEAIARLFDARLDLAERGRCAERLARAGSPDAVAALHKAFRFAPPEHRPFLAQLIGSAGNPSAKPLLLPFLDETNAPMVKAAVRGLSVIGGEEVTARIAALLADARRAEDIRIEAALGLGTIGTPAARDALTEAFSHTPSGELVTQLLDSLGHFEFQTVAATFERFLSVAETPSQHRVAAAEALAHSSAEAVPFLLGLAGSDADVEVRASAAWAISAQGGVSDVGPALLDLAESEPEADVRRRLYEALLPQAEIAGDRVLRAAQSEKDIAARVAGFNAVGRAARLEPDSGFTAVFDREIVPELLRIATASNSLNVQMRAVFALRRAQTAAAQAALGVVADGARPQVATAARNGFQSARQSTQ